MSHDFPFAQLSLGVISILVVALTLSRDPLIRNRWPAGVVAGYWGVLVIYMLGTREVRYGSDMAVYLKQFALAAANPSLLGHLQSVASDRGFAAFQWGVSRFGSDPRIFTVAVALLSVFAVWLAARLVLPWPSATAVLFACTLSPFFVFYATNTVRQGLAVSVLLAGAAAILSECSRTRRGGLALVVISPLIHLAALVPAVLAVYVRWRPVRTSHSLWIWATTAALYVTGVNAGVLGFLGGGGERIAQYAEFGVIKSYGGGVNRLDFLAVSLFLVLCVTVLERAAKDVEPHVRRRAHYLVTLLVLWNSYFLAMGFLAYSDRFAAFSWLLFPICAGYLVLAPSLERGQLVRLAYVLSPLMITMWLQGVPDVLQRTSSVG